MYNFKLTCSTCGASDFILQTPPDDRDTIRIYCPTCESEIASFSCYALKQLPKSTEATDDENPAPTH